MRSLFSLTVIFVLLLVLPAAPVRARDNGLPVGEGGRDNPGIPVLDGSGVHDVGELHLHTGNWGIFGSYPSASTPVSSFPSAEWPAGSGVEHLYISGLWIGARKGCILGDQVIGVSTAAYEMEFQPTDDPIDKIYETYEGATGGSRLPFPGADDDGDGLFDEDPLDGRDNDGDGRIDEDFAAISQQMFGSCYTDDQPAVMQVLPEHMPLNVAVRQESYQWTDPRFDDFVGITFTIKNMNPDTGPYCLNSMYLGFFVDPDIGMRDVPGYWNDDEASLWQGIRCTELGPADISVAYAHDYDGDGGQATSYIGFMILGHPVSADGTGGMPTRIGLTSFQMFSGDQPYENGGEPTNDYQRYELMSRHSIDRGMSGGDVRFLMSTGPFDLYMGNSMTFHVGIVAGGSLEELLDNAAMCQKLFDGQWFDMDGDPATGTDRRETMVAGPATRVVIDPCRDELSDLLAVARGETLWVNADCEREQELKETCQYSEADSMLFRTGVGGRETHVNWIIDRHTALEACLDIKPGTCRNPFNIKLFEFLAGCNRKKGGVMPVAILGSEGFDVTDIDVSTVRLNGVAPLRKGESICDVAGPGESDGPCHCAEEGPDGYPDLLLKFSNQEIAATRLILSIPEPGEKWVLNLKGELEGGTVFTSSDCVTFVGRPPSMHKPDRPMLLTGETRLVGASPNPFNPSTRIAFELASPGEVSIRVYDVTGRLIEILVEGSLPAGLHEVTWNGRDGKGIPAASGIYFYRLIAGQVLQTRKMVLLR